MNISVVAEQPDGRPGEGLGPVMNDTSPTGSVTQWISELKQGSDDAAEQLWRRYFEQLQRLARQRLGKFPRRAADEEDVAVVVLRALFDGAANGNFSRLTDRQDLWYLLIKITKQESANLMRRENRHKRGGGKVRDEQALSQGLTDTVPDLGRALIDDELTPDFLVALDDQIRYLLNVLDDKNHRRAAVMRIAGYTNEEIADAMGRTSRTIERWLAIVRETWEALLSK